MAVFLAAGLHQHTPGAALSTLSTGWYQLTDGVRREVTLPAALLEGCALSLLAGADDHPV